MKKRLVFLSGAGISAESGLKTFRDSDGLWNGYNIEEVATPRAFAQNPQRVLDFYNMRRRDVFLAQPNAAHRAIAELEAMYDVVVITQNIDDLHERAGSTNILHLHGEITMMRSVTDPSIRSVIRGDIQLGDHAPDGGQWRPDIVWFEEPVPMIDMAAAEIVLADWLVVIGTSLQVYPAAGLIHYAKPEAQKFVIDRSIPSIPAALGFQPIEATATEGMQLLIQQINEKCPV
jgi:NAD-dependent deacetylase